ncbi:MAG: prolipoprotein diacylglyceryl transferase family protein [Pseudomonadota bacterium]
MPALEIGPFSLPAGYVLLMIAFVVALVVGAVTARRQGMPVAGKTADLLVIAVLSARVGFVALYFEHYQGDVLGMLDIRDGGFHVPSGLLGCVVVGLYWLWRHPALRRPLGFALAAGLITWAGARTALTMLESEAMGIPDVALAQPDGTPVTLSSVGDGEPRVVNLWATWCPPCVREMPLLDEAEERHDGVTFVFVNQGEHADVVDGFLAEHALSLDHVLLDARGELGRATGSRALPTTLFYDASGRLVDAHRGELSRATLARGLESFDPEHVAGDAPP